MSAKDYFDKQKGLTSLRSSTKGDASKVEDLWRSDKYGYKYNYDDDNSYALEQIIVDYPTRVAELLDQYGFNPHTLM